MGKGLRRSPVGHQHESVQTPAVAFHRPQQPLQPLLPIGIIAHDGLPLVPTRDHVVQGVCKFDSQGPGHAVNYQTSYPASTTNA